MVGNDELKELSLRWLNILSNFQKTQPRKKRQNTYRALWKLKNGKPLNRLEKEAIEQLMKYVLITQSI